MDELNRWQLEERARQVRELNRWLENSGWFETMRLMSGQLQALDDSGLFEAAEGTMAVVRDLTNSAPGTAIQLQATCAEVIAAVAGLHRQYAGIGTTFLVSSSEADSDGGIIHERRLTLPADNARVPDGEEATSGKEVAKLIKGSLSATLDPISVSATGQVSTVINTPSNWSFDRSENSEGQHLFIFRGVGGDEMRSKVDCIADFAHWIADNDESAKERVLSSFLSTNGASIAKLPKLTRKDPGRKPDTEYNTAYQMIVDGGYTDDAADRAYAYCCAQRGIANPTQDDRNAFNEAMKRRHRTRRARPT